MMTSRGGGGGAASNGPAASAAVRKQQQGQQQQQQQQSHLDPRKDKLAYFKDNFQTHDEDDFDPKIYYYPRQEKEVGYSPPPPNDEAAVCVPCVCDTLIATLTLTGIS
jgi:membrane protease subunit (stomatin/prohibitin family)